MIKAVIFDFDDTLVESRVAKWNHHKHVAKKFYNIDLTDEDIRPHWGKPIDQLLQIFYRNSDTLENMYKALISVRSDFMKIEVPGASEMITGLLDGGIKVGVVSATNKRFLIDDLSNLGFPIDRFEFIQGADDTDVHKPDPRVFNNALEKLASYGIDKEEIVYVGDSIDDHQAASGAGMGFIAVTTGLYSLEEFRQEGADKIVESLLQIKEFLKD